MRNGLRLGLAAMLATSFSATCLASGQSNNDAPPGGTVSGGTVSISPKPDEPLNPSNRQGIIIEGRTKSAGGDTAIGPKPDEPLNPSNRQGIIIEGRTKSAGGDTAIGPKPDEPLNPSNRQGIIIEGRTKSAGGDTAIGPKPDEPLNPSSRTNRAAPSDGPGMSGAGGNRGIIIEGKTKGGSQGTVTAGQASGTTAIGPKPDEPRVPSRSSTGPLVNPRDDAAAPH